jgi:hypothetical protein
MMPIESILDSRNLGMYIRDFDQRPMSMFIFISEIVEVKHKKRVATFEFIRSSAQISASRRQVAKVFWISMMIEPFQGLSRV